ncbi:hypothetical protein L195_g047868 [Trifolium pratense]|uniref:Uncharacterized protein n=1 Tax=Trifolium pratense TaxID=57577 RepID=A0A2K3MLU7_TRIPR|nr:hypothetical protein L195_g047868 [Trifolium pratense]
MGGLRKIGTLGLKEVGGDDDSDEEQKGLLRLIREEFKSVEKVYLPLNFGDGATEPPLLSTANGVCGCHGGVNKAHKLEWSGW